MGNVLGGVKAQPLTKALVKKADELTYFSIAAAFADDADFLALAKIEATRGERRVAAKLTGDGFLLASPNPSPEEIMVSLSASLSELTKAPPPLTNLADLQETSMIVSYASSPLRIVRTKLGPPTTQVFETLGAYSPIEALRKNETIGGIVDAVLRVTYKSAEFVGYGAQFVGEKAGLVSPTLSKPVVKRGGSEAAAAIVAAFEGSAAFEALVLAEVEAAMGKRRAAQRMAEGFLLAGEYLPSTC